MAAIPIDVRFTPKSGHLPSMAGAIASRACASIRSLTTVDEGFQPMTADRTVIHLEGTDFQKSRAFSPAVVTQGGKIVWLAGQTALIDLDRPDGQSRGWQACRPRHYDGLNQRSAIWRPIHQNPTRR